MDATEAAVPTPVAAPASHRGVRAGHWTGLRWVAPITVAVLAVAVSIAGGIMFDSVGSIWVFQGTWLVRELVPGAVVFAVVGVAVLRHPPARAVGWTMLGLAASWALSVLAAGLFLRSTMIGSTISIQFFVVSQTLGTVGVFLGLVLLPLVFPSGWLSGRGWRAATLLLVALFLVSAVVFTWANWESFIPEDRAPLDWDDTHRLNLVAWYAGLLLVTATLAERVRRGPQLVRQQIAPFAILWLVAVAADELHAAEYADSDSSLAYLTVWIWPVVVALVIGFTVVQVGLWNTRLVVRRFVVYLTMTALLTLVFAAAYFAVLLTLSSKAVDDRYRSIALLVAAVAVIAADPLRRRVGASLEHRLLGERGQPLKPLARLDALTSAGSAEEADVYATMVDTVAEAVRSPGASLALHQAPDIVEVAATGDTVSDPVVLPLLHRGERLGELRVATRTPGEAYGRSDRALLDRLASQVAALVYGLRRDSDITALRSDAIDALVEQRMALGRDLHDQLAPLLAGAGLTAEALRRGMPSESPDAEEAARLARRLRTAASEVRRISHDLQPTPDGPHLTGVIIDYVASVRGPSAPTFNVDLDSAEGRLSATAELGLSRVALEAITNVVRHAQARRADISLGQAGDEVVLTVADDGIGIAQPYVSGLGITSMRSRVQALGGAFELHPRTGGGTVLTARVPVSR